MSNRKRTSLLGNQTVADVAESFTEAVENDRDFFATLPPPDFTNTVSTGCLVLDLTISGAVLPYGGVPSGILVEMYGPSQSGKTSLLSEMCGSAVHRGGESEILDPEARLSKEYSRIYGVQISEDNYSRPDTVTEVFDHIYTMSTERRKPFVLGVDSLAALSTKLELESGDKMGMRRAKEFSEGLRKTCRLIANNGHIVACTNQVRHGDHGETTPGGQGMPFYSSLRLRIAKKEETIRTAKIYGKERSKVTGIKSDVTVVKSSIDDPYRNCTIFIIFGYGVHDIMTSLQYLKNMQNKTQYPAVDHDYTPIEQAVAHIEKNNLEQPLRDEVVRVWREVYNKFHIDRKPKIRF